MVQTTDLNLDIPQTNSASWTGESIGILTIAGFFIVAPAFIYPVFLMKAICFALFACAFNLLFGYIGLLSFGHAMFFGWSSYVCAYTIKAWGFTPELAILAGTSLAALLGFLAGTIAIRRQGIYFAMITLAIAQMMYFAALQAPFTGGEDGIQSVAPGRLFGVFDLEDPTNSYVFVLTVFLLCLGMMHRVIHSPFGEVLRAIKENETRALSLGYKTNRYKLIAFVLSASFAGMAGAVKAIVFHLASLADVHWSTSGEVVLMTIVGGIGTMFGPVLGAFVMVGMESYLAEYGQWVTMIQGCVFVVCVMAFRRGLVGELGRAWRMWR
ncbi:branched-chain amino acid ABC transporter permease [Bradyrhizobium ottawaense]|uniref:branched-chain amino acid ABC transporter permease n=1 Tax=Bradyrhizobium ottawaense TaxID=931866 RepID=UPI003832D8F7